MRVAIVGSEGIEGLNTLYVYMDRFIKLHGSKNLTIVAESMGDVAVEVEKFCYARGFNFINLPLQKFQDSYLFISNVDKVLAFLDANDKRLTPFLRKFRRSGVPVMSIVTNEEIDV